MKFSFKKRPQQGEIRKFFLSVECTQFMTTT